MDCFGTYFTHVQTCNVTRVQSATEWTNSRSAVTGKGMKKSGAWKTGGLSSHRCWPQNTVRVVNHTEKSKKTKKSMIPISGSKWWFCHSEIKDYMFSWDGKKSGGKFMPAVFPLPAQIFVLSFSLSQTTMVETETFQAPFQVKKRALKAWELLQGFLVWPTKPPRHDSKTSRVGCENLSVLEGFFILSFLGH